MKVFLFHPCRLGRIRMARVGAQPQALGVHNIETTAGMGPFRPLWWYFTYICIYPSVLLPCFQAEYLRPCLARRCQKSLVFTHWVSAVTWIFVFPLKIHQGFPGGSVDKESACGMGEMCSIPGLGRAPGEGNGNPLQYPCLENPMDRGAWWPTVHGVAKSQTRLSD